MFGLRAGAQVSHLAEAVAQTATSTPGGAGSLLGHESLGIAQSRLQTAAAEELRNGFAQLQAAK